MTMTYLNLMGSLWEIYIYTHMYMKIKIFQINKNNKHIIYYINYAVQAWNLLGAH